MAGDEERGETRGGDERWAGGAAGGGASPWAGLGTETRHPESRDLDLLPTERVVALLLEEDRRGLDAALARAAEIAAAAER
ncbi:MAG TPA: hypothetical protein VHM02_11885, partial [Thermoanaerobaculia bacterium]|nr:hypothetical protein [Thermoanaerobaculia bacterium]